MEVAASRLEHLARHADRSTLTRRQLFWGLGLASIWGRLSDRLSAQLGPEILYDSDGLIVHKNMDGGDTAQREGWYWFGVWIRQEVLKDPWPVPRKRSFAEVIQLLEPNSDGIFYRHPTLSPWNNPYSKEFGFSRDQLVPLVAAMGVWGLTDPLRRLWNALPQDVLGGTKHTFNGEWKTIFGQKTIFTGDIVGPATINLFRRAWNEDPMPASDHNGPGGETELAANVDIRIASTLNDRDNTGDDLNLVVMLLMAALRFPSKVSAGAAVRYAKNRPVSYGSFLGAYREKYGVDMSVPPNEVKRRLDEGIAPCAANTKAPCGWKTDASRVYGAARWYHRLESGANPQLAELYAPVIRKYLE
jgi:hypothetical protein